MPGTFEVKGTAQFRRTAARLKAAGAGKVRREMAKEMRSASKPAVEDAQANVLGIESRGVRGRGGQQRREYTVEKSKTKTERVKRKAAEGRGLRATVARTLRVQVRATAKNATVRIQVDKKQLPEDQRELPFYINKGKWRHPVFGNRHNWVAQSVSPTGWFDRAMLANRRNVRNQAVSVVDDINRRIAE